MGRADPRHDRPERGRMVHLRADARLMRGDVIQHLRGGHDQPPEEHQPTVAGARSPARPRVAQGSALPGVPIRCAKADSPGQPALGARLRTACAAAFRTAAPCGHQQSHARQPAGRGSGQDASSASQGHSVPGRTSTMPACPASALRNQSDARDRKAIALRRVLPAWARSASPDHRARTPER